MTGEIFYATYVETPPKGTTPAQFRISFLLEGFTGPTTELLPYAEDSPCKISMSLPGDDIFEPIGSLNAVFLLQVTSVLQAEKYYVTEDQQMQAQVMVDYTGGTNYTDTVFLGWVQPNGLRFDYRKPPFKVKINATDGLSTLKSRPLLDSTGKRLSGMVSFIQVMHTALARTGLALNLQTGVSLYEGSQVAIGQTTNGRANPAIDPLYHATVHAESFVKENKLLSGYDALTKILNTFNLRLSQWGGVWRAYRVDEMAGGWDVWNGANPTIHTRLYTGSGADVATFSHASVDLNGQAYINTPLQVKKESPTVGLDTIKPGVRVEQDFGGYLDKLENGNFAQVGSDGIPVGWHAKNLDTPSRVVHLGTGTEEDPYRVRIYGSDYEGFIESGPGATQGIYYQYNWPNNNPDFVSIIEKNKKTTRTLKGRFRLNKTRGAKIVVREFARTFEAPWWILADGDVWIKNPKAKQRVGILKLNDVLANNVDTPKPGWCDFSLTLPPVDFDPGYGKGINGLNIMLCKAYTLERYDSQGHVLEPITEPDSWIEYANIEIVEEDETISIDGIQRSFSKKDREPETELTLTFGDIPLAAGPADRKGGLYARNTNTAAANFYRPDQAIGPQGQNADKGKLILDWLLESRVKQAMLPAAIFDGELYGRLPAGPHTILRISDINPTASYNPATAIPHILIQWDYDTRGCTHEVSAKELNTGKAMPTGYTDTREWQTKDGEILIENDPATGLPIGPPVPARLGAVGLLRAQLGSIGGVLPNPIPLPANAPALFVPQEPNDLRLTATGYVNGKEVGTTFSALRRTTLFETPP